MVARGVTIKQFRRLGFRGFYIGFGRIFYAFIGFHKMNGFIWRGIEMGDPQIRPW